MKQLLQSLKNGKTEVASVPCPVDKRGHVLIRTTRSLISAGTERMLVDFGKANLIDKARQQPDKVRMVLDKIKTDGLLPTIETVLNKLDQPVSMGYCNVGTVASVGEGVAGFPVGDRVASNGNHAETVRVPANLCAKIPDNVSDDEAAFTVIGAIALQGIRLVQPTLGEAIAVTGLGLVGLMTVQLLQANGCRVFGLDFDPKRLALARQFGAEVADLSLGGNPLAAAETFSRGQGLDAVIVTAATTSSEPIHQAALMCRKRGRIVLVGVTGLELSRDDFYKKELTFQVSASYGPGRYDPNYEEKGQDYPFGFVRWTEQRNFEAVLDMMAQGHLNVKPLISHHFSIDDAENAYKVVSGADPSLGILLEYPNRDQGAEDILQQRTVKLVLPPPPISTETGKATRASIAFIGSGNYATSVLIPAFKKTRARLRCVASSAGVSGTHAAKKYGFEETTTETERVFLDSEINAVVITTRHDSHAQMVVKALEAGKHVFVEKPLALALDELKAIESVYATLNTQDKPPPLLMVGFNRRFAPHVQKIKHLLEGVTAPKVFIMTVNAGAIPAGHWVQDVEVGGGRIVGEACHFIDLLRFLAGAPIDGFQAISIAKTPGGPITNDKASLTLRFGDGSFGVIHYLANGHKSFPKERLEIFAEEGVLQLDNFRRLTGFGWPGIRTMNLWRQNKGQRECAAAFIRAVEQGGPSPIPFEELMEVSRVTIQAAEALR